MPTDWEERRRRREADLERRTEAAVRRLRGQRPRSGPGSRWTTAKRAAGAALFVGALIGVWFLAPQLGLWGQEAREEFENRRREAAKSLEVVAEDLVDDVAEATGVDIELPASDATVEAGVPVGDWGLPLGVIDADRLARPHHDYPAWDYGVPVGTEILAMASGRVSVALDDDGDRCGGIVTIASDDGAQITYCHLSAVAVERGDRVEPGDVVGRSGGEPGAPGAGNTSGPHLHLQIRVDGQLRCPQAQLVALAEGLVLAPDELPADGCFYSGSAFADVEREADEDDPFFSWD